MQLPLLVARVDKGRRLTFCRCGSIRRFECKPDSALRAVTNEYRINDVELNVRDQGQGENALLFLHYWGEVRRVLGARLSNVWRMTFDA